MTDHLDLSRITKAFTDTGHLSFAEAEARLKAVRLTVVISADDIRTPAGQACVLTVLATAGRTFGHLTLVAVIDAPLIRRQPSSHTLYEFALAHGVHVASRSPADTTHLIALNNVEHAAAPKAYRCWWDGWLSGVLPDWEARRAGESWNPLAGVLAGALVVREVFADIRGVRPLKLEGNVVSLWEPWAPASNAAHGPSTVYLARAMTIVGLGHLGQALLWNLALLPGHGDCLVLHDYQTAGAENAPTGLLTTSHDIGERKTRIAGKWIEYFGWQTAFVERKFMSWVKAEPDDPAVVISALDKPEPRKRVLAAGFHRMLDIGVGHGPVDFEIGQLRSFVAGEPSTWSEQNNEANVDTRLEHKAYRVLNDPCGAFQLASASVAVPFVGAALGALCVAQLLRLGAMKGIPSLLQIELTAPEMPSFSPPSAGGPPGFGCVEIDLLRASGST